MKKEDKNFFGNSFYELVLFFAAVILLMLPFHYVLSFPIKIFPKNSFTFSYTFITQEDIDELIERYNKASLFEKEYISNEPLFRKLKEKEIIEWQK